MAGRGRSHSSLGFQHDAPGGREKSMPEKGERSFWKDKVIGEGVRAASTGPNIGRGKEPAATFSYDSRKKNLNPGVRKDLTTPPKPPKALTKSVVATKPSYKIRQIQREEASKNRYKVPDVVEKIEAEKQITDNPLLHPQEDQDDEPGRKRSIDSLTLHDLCKLRVAFECADEDGSGELDQTEFVDAFLPVLGVNESEVHLLFMRIDANSDGAVSWDEFLAYVLSQDEGQLNIVAEASRQLFDYPNFADNALHIHGHKDSASGLLHLEDVDRYASFSRKGEVLIWRPDCLDSVSKVIHPREFETNLPFITQLVHVKRLSHSDRLAVCSADKQLIFLDLMRETFKQTGHVKVDCSPLCMCSVVVRDEVGDIVEEMICIGDDQGQLHLFDTEKLYQTAARNMVTMSSSHADNHEMLGSKSAHVKTWKAHEHHAWVSKVAYYDDGRMLISAASDGQLVISDALKGIVKIDGFRHRGDIADFIWLKKFQLLASCGLERHINLWQIPIKTPTYKLEGHQGSIQQLAYGSEQLISIDTTKTIIVWDLREMMEIQRLEGMKMHQEFPIGRFIYDNIKQGFVTIAKKPLFWHITERQVPSGHTTPVSCAVYNPLFQTLVSADDSSGVRVWNLNTGQAITKFANAHLDAKGQPVKITSVSFDKTQRRLITGAHNGSIKIWNFSTGQALKEVEGFGDGEVTGLACMFMTPYDYIIATGWNRRISFWIDSHALNADNRKIQPQHHLEGPKEDILCMTSYPDHGLLVTGAYDGDIVIWNLETMHARAHLVLPGLASMKTELRAIEAMQLVGVHSNLAYKLSSKAKSNKSVVLLFTASADGVLRTWSTDETAELLHEWPLERDTKDAGICAMDACEKGKVLLLADAWGEVYVNDISGTMGSANSALPPICNQLAPPVQCAKFKAHDEVITVLIYINTRRLIVTGCTDTTMCLWTMAGEKMGTFGQQVDWRLTSKLHDFARQSEQPVFAKKCTSEITDENDAQKRKGRRQHTFRMGHQRSSALLGKENSAGDNSVPATPIGGDSASAFMTQLEQDIEEQEGLRDGEDGLEVEEDFDANWQDYYSSGSSQDSDSEIEDETAAKKTKGTYFQDEREKMQNLVLKEDINAIIARGVAMKDRGDKFYEAGSAEMGTYGKMILRDLSDCRVPDNIQRKIIMHKKGQTSQGGKGILAREGLQDSETDEEPNEEGDAARAVPPQPAASAQ